MSTVKLSNYPGRDRSSHGFIIGGVKTEIDGVEVREVTGINLVAMPDDAARLTIGMFVQEPFEVEIDASVTINIAAVEGCEVIDATDYSVNKRMLIVRKQEDTLDANFANYPKGYLARYAADLRRRAEAVEPGPIRDLLLKQAEEAQRLQDTADAQWKKSFGEKKDD